MVRCVGFSQLSRRIANSVVENNRVKSKKEYNFHQGERREDNEREKKIVKDENERREERQCKCDKETN